MKTTLMWTANDFFTYEIVSYRRTHEKINMFILYGE